MPKKTRPLLAIDHEQVTKLAERQWRNREIAAFFNCDEGTIRKRFSASLEKGRDSGKGKLRDLQWKAALNGNTAMLIFLGKQYLDQADKTDTMGEIKLTQMPSIKIDGKDLEFKVGS